MNIGIIGGIVGSVIGVAGGMYGAYRSYTGAKSSREQRFVIWASIACLLFVGSFLAVLFLLPQTRPALFVPYSIILAAGIGYLNRRQSKIQREEQT
jgi:hypothetical protein